MNSCNALIQLMESLPKTEIHIHLIAVISPATVMKLNEKYDLEPVIESEEELAQRINVRSLNEMIDVFKKAQALIRNMEDFDLLFGDLFRYIEKNNIEYAEFFIAPTFLLRNLGISMKTLLNHVEILIDSRPNRQRELRYIVDISRSYGVDNAWKNYRDIASCREALRYFIGIGLGGQERGNHAASYAPIFQDARKNGVNRVVHAGEDDGSESIRSAIDDLYAQRIGHATSAMLDPALIVDLAERQIPIEVCVTSNCITGRYVSDPAGHPVRAFFDKGVFVTINSDDPTIFQCSVSSEYALIHEKNGFSLDEIVRLMRNGLFATFLSDEEKERRWRRMEEEISRKIDAHTARSAKA